MKHLSIPFTHKANYSLFINNVRLSPKKDYTAMATLIEFNFELIVGDEIVIRDENNEWMLKVILP